MHALFELNPSHFCEENPSNRVYTDYCIHASEIIFVLISPKIKEIRFFTGEFRMMNIHEDKKS